jgi:hypothetical protein
MKRTLLGAFLLLPMLTMPGCAVSGHSTPSAADGDLETLAKYRKWTLVNPTPQLMEPLPANSCTIMVGREDPSPHVQKYVSVFVNPVGREQMMTKHNPKFPAGSMIVKEKHGSLDTTATPEVLTVMIKRDAGYDPENGDWEYLVLTGGATKIVEQGKLTRCSGCHKWYKHNDFVTRTYLPTNVVAELKP